MDPLSVIGLVSSLLIIVQVAARTTQLARISGSVRDPKIDTIITRCYTEQARFANWKDVMGIKDDSDIEAIASQMDGDRREQMLFIYKKLTDWEQTMREKLQSYGLVVSGAPRDRRSLNTIAQRMKWATISLPQLQELAESLSHLNEGLKVVVQVPPSYYYNPATGRVLPPGAVGVNPPNSAGPWETTPPSSQTDPFVPHTSLSTQENYAFEPTIRLLYSVSVNALQFLVTRISTHKAELRQTATELRLWGQGLFDEVFTIDEMLNSRSRQDIREFILGTLGDIGATIEYLCIALAEENKTDTSVLKEREKLISVLGLPEIAETILDDPYLMNGPAAISMPSTMYIGECSKALHSLVGALFDVLPTLQRLQCVGILRSQKDQSKSEAESSSLVLAEGAKISLITANCGPASDVAELDIELVQALAASLRQAQVDEAMEEERALAKEMHDALTPLLQELVAWRNSTAYTIDTDPSPAKRALQEASLTNLTRIARTWENVFPESAKSQGLSRAGIQKRIEHNLSDFSGSMSDTGSLDFSGTSAATLGEFIEIFRDSNNNLKNLARSVDSSTTPSVDKRKLPKQHSKLDEKVDRFAETRGIGHSGVLA